MSTNPQGAVFTQAGEFGKKSSRESEPRSAGWQTVTRFMQTGEKAVAVVEMPGKNGEKETDLDKIYSYLTHAAKEFNKRNSPADKPTKFVEVHRGIVKGTNRKEVQLHRIADPPSPAKVESAVEKPADKTKSADKGTKK